MKKILFLSLICFSIGISAQEIPSQEDTKKDTTFWRTDIKTGFTFNSVKLYNWKGGGIESTSIGALALGKTTYQREKMEWVSQMDLQYATIQNDGQKKYRKSVDKLSLDSKFAYRFTKKWNAFSSLSFLTQFDNGYKYNENDSALEISDFMAPAYITSSWGGEYKPNDFFYVRVSPFSPRITIVNDTTIYHDIPENYGVDIGKTTRYEWKAFKITASFDKNIVENISLKANYELFANMEDITFDNIDHRIDIIATAKIYKFINMTMTSNFIKDLDQVDIEGGDDKWQASFQVGLSILFSYKNYKE